jgi:hypothetical protein
MISLRLATSISVSLCLLLGLATADSARANEEKPAASLIKVEGDGDAMLRRKNGMESRAGVPLSLYAGDKITTDAKSMVELQLPDGSLISVGLNSEYKIESAEKKPGFVAWVFQLTKGSMRALVEKSGDKKNVRVRVNTPAGTMGVRGTEFLIEHDEKTELTNLFTFHGAVEFGGEDCKKSENCVLVKDRMTSSIKKGDRRAREPKPFAAKDMLSPQASVEAGENVEKKKEAMRARLAMILGSLKKAEAQGPAAEKAKDLDWEAMMKSAEEKMQAAQNTLMGRDEVMRKAMDAAKEAGTYQEVLRLSDKAYGLAKGNKGSVASSLSNSSMETGRAQAKRFALGKALVERGALLGDREDNQTGGLVKHSTTAYRAAASERLAAGMATNREFNLKDFNPEQIRQATEKLNVNTVKVALQREEVAVAAVEVERIRAYEEQKHIVNTLAQEEYEEVEQEKKEVLSGGELSANPYGFEKEKAYTVPKEPEAVQRAPASTQLPLCDLKSGRACKKPEDKKKPAIIIFIHPSTDR